MPIYLMKNSIVLKLRVISYHTDQLSDFFKWVIKPPLHGYSLITPTYDKISLPFHKWCECVLTSENFVQNRVCNFVLGSLLPSEGCVESRALQNTSCYLFNLTRNLPKLFMLFVWWKSTNDVMSAVLVFENT